jgi:hypothetical protein
LLLIIVGSKKKNRKKKDVSKKNLGETKEEYKLTRPWHMHTIHRVAGPASE